jgi:hypothetical protein
MTRNVVPSTRIMAAKAWVRPVQWRGQLSVSRSAADQMQK